MSRPRDVTRFANIPSAYFCNKFCQRWGPQERTSEHCTYRHSLLRPPPCCIQCLYASMSSLLSQARDRSNAKFGAAQRIMPVAVCVETEFCLYWTPWICPILRSAVFVSVCVCVCWGRGTVCLHACWDCAADCRVLAIKYIELEQQPRCPIYFYMQYVVASVLILSSRPKTLLHSFHSRSLYKGTRYGSGRVWSVEDGLVGASCTVRQHRSYFQHVKRQIGIVHAQTKLAQISRADIKQMWWYKASMTLTGEGIELTASLCLEPSRTPSCIALRGPPATQYTPTCMLDSTITLIFTVFFMTSCYCARIVPCFWS